MEYIEKRHAVCSTTLNASRNAQRVQEERNLHLASPALQTPVSENNVLPVALMIAHLNPERRDVNVEEIASLNFVPISQFISEEGNEHLAIKKREPDFFSLI